ncbi:MAG: hypothetical protein ABIB47_00475 [Candidatus Woesearchaeota archaeon]
MRKLLIISLLMMPLLLLADVALAEDGGYCKVSGDIASYWLFEDSSDGEDICDILGDFFGLNTVWLDFEVESQSEIEGKSDFCDGWAGECEDDYVFLNNVGPSGSRNRDRDDDCMDQWECTDWGPCAGGIQFRSCADMMACGNYYNSPDESKECTSSGTVLINEEAYNGNTNEDSEGITGRAIGDRPSGLGTFGYVIIGVIVLLILGGGLAVYLRR